MRWIGFLRRTARFECLLYIATEGNQSRPRDKLRLRRKFGVWGALSDAQFKATQDPPLLEPDAQGWGTLHTFLVLGARVPGQNQGLVSRPDNPRPRRKFGAWGPHSDAPHKGTQDPPLLEPDAQGGTLRTFLVLSARVPGVGPSDSWRGAGARLYIILLDWSPVAGLTSVDPLPCPETANPQLG